MGHRVFEIENINNGTKKRNEIYVNKKALKAITVYNLLLVLAYFRKFLWLFYSIFIC